MDEAEVLVGKNLDLQLAAREELMEPRQAALGRFAAGIYEGFGLGAAPFLPECGRGCAGGRHVLRM